MTIKIENTKDKINEVGHTCLFYGQSGNGKTTFASTAKDVLFLDTENSTKGLGSRNIYVDVIDFKRFPNKDNMHELKEIEDIVKQKKYKTIVIDTIDMLVDSMTNDKQLFFKDSERQSDGSLTQKGYGALSRKLKNFIRSFVDCDIDVILLCHEKEVKDINGVNIGIKPALPASLNNFIFSRVETVGLIKSIINPKTKQQEVWVSVEPTGDATSGKDRMGNIAAWKVQNKTDKLPADYEKLREIVMGAKRSKSKKEFTGFVKDLDADDDGISGDIAINQKEEIEKGVEKQEGGESLLGL